MTLRDDLASIVAYAEDDYLREHGTLNGSAYDVADRIIAYLESTTPEPVYEYGIRVKLSEESHGPDKLVIHTVPNEATAVSYKDDGVDITAVRRTVGEWEEIAPKLDPMPWEKTNGVRLTVEEADTYDYPIVFNPRDGYIQDRLDYA